jgi:sugar O-acyltransferase (sialic acid O-acetyltransferase NeuD family)
VIVLGGGGHAKVVISSLRLAGYVVGAAYDDDPLKHGRTVAGVPVLGPIAHAPDEPERRYVAAIGDNRLREQVVKRFHRAEWVTVVHPSAVVDPSVVVGAGSTILAGAIIQAESRIGHHVIVNTAASVDHDCEVDDFAHLAPGSRLGGSVRVGRCAFAGIGASVLPGGRLGDDSVLGAGGVLLRDLPEGTVAVGVPATPIRSTVRR